MPAAVAPIICPACDKPTRAYAELDPGRGMVRRCGNEGCGAGLPPEVAPAPASPPPPSPAPVLTLVKGGASASAPAAAAASAPIAWDDMAAQLRARRVFILAKLEEARELRLELDRIEAFLSFDATPTAE